MPDTMPALTLAVMLAVGHCWTIGTGYRADMGMQLVNGSCLFENITIAAGESLRQESPCRRVSCIERHKAVFIQECTTYYCPSTNCRMEAQDGLYPSCCPRPVYVGN
uniref:Putative 8.9 kDa family member n=1 Tax=Amblyomma aureolatum TaxID=187763 RepID=A0A1E1WYR8_9ACAR